MQYEQGTSGVFNIGGKSVSHLQMIDKKVLTLYSFMLKVQAALIIAHFFNKLGRGLECCNPPPVQARRCSKSEDVPYELGTSIFSKNKDVQYEQGTCSVQMKVCSTNKGHHQVLENGGTSTSYC